MFIEERDPWKDITGSCLVTLYTQGQSEALKERIKLIPVGQMLYP